MSEPITFTNDDHLATNKEGWCISPNLDGSGNVLELQKLDEDEVFASDDKAWEFVIARAVSGSKLHQKAIAYIKQESPDEFNEFVKDAKVTNENGNSMLVFHNEAFVTFPSEGHAQAARAHYRKCVSLG